MDIKKLGSHSVKLSDLKIGAEFVFGGMTVRNRITDIGSRTAAFIRLDQENERNYNGPPYSVPECVLDEYDLDGITVVSLPD